MKFLHKFSKNFKKRGYSQFLFLIIAIGIAAIAQNSLPPPYLTLTVDNPLPAPVWRTALLLEDQLIPYRLSIFLFLIAGLMVIYVFWGKTFKYLPWEKFSLTLSSQNQVDHPSSDGLYFDQDRNSGRIIITFLFSRLILISVGLVILASIFSAITYFLFKTYAQTNLGLAFWVFSILLLLASVSIYDFFISKPPPYKLAEFLWAFLAVIYTGMTIWLLSIYNIWGLATTFFAIASFFSWKFSRPKLVAWINLKRPLEQDQSSYFAPPKAAPWRTNISMLFDLLSKNLEIIIFIFIIGLGIGFRFIHIMDMAPGINNDVALLEGVATTFLRGTVAYSPFSSVGWGFETLFLYYIAFWMRIVGINIFSAKIASATVGAATLVVVYFLARRTAGKQVAWISTTLLAVSGVHIILSTLGSRLILQPLFEALTFLLFWLAFEKRKYWLFILTGISLGFTVQSYNASVFDPFLFLGFFAYLVVRNRFKVRTIFHNYLIGMLALLIAFLITAAPLFGYMSNNWDVYKGRSNSLLVTTRMKESEIKNPGTYWSPAVRNLLVGSLLFNQRGNSNDLFIEEPALDFPVNILLVIALAFTIRFWYKPLPFFLLSWFFFGLSASYVSEPNFNRSIACFIPIYLMGGLMIHTIGRNIIKKFHQKGKYIAFVLTAVFLASCAVYTYTDYIGPNYKFRWGYAEKPTGAGVYVSKLSDKYDIFITDSYYVTDTVRMLNYRPDEDYFVRPYRRFFLYDVLASDRFPNDPDNSIQDHRDVVIVLGGWPEEERAKDILLKLFPRSKLEIIPKIDTHWKNEDNVGYGVFISYDDFQHATPLLNGLTSKYYSEWDGQGELLGSFVDPLLTLPPSPDPAMGKFSATWEGTFPADLAGTYMFQLRSNNRVQLFVDDQPVVAISEFDPDNPENNQLISGGIDLLPGNHKVKIIYNYEAASLRVSVDWKPPDRDYILLPVWTFTP